MTDLYPCPCGKPTGVLSRYVGENLHYQVCCSDSECPLLYTYDSKEADAEVHNRLHAAYNLAKAETPENIAQINRYIEYAIAGKGGITYAGKGVFLFCGKD